MKQVFLTICLFFIYSFVFSQKVSRACNALAEGKLSKAIELFSEVMEKNPQEVPALVGYARTIYELVNIYKMTSEDGPNQIAQVYYENSINYLNLAEKLYVTIDYNDNEILKKKLAVNNSNEINLLKIKLSDYLWLYHYASKDNIDSLELFERVFAFGEKTNRDVKKRLSFLYYNSAKKSNTIENYKGFIAKFPQSYEYQLAIKDIEDIETQDAITNPRKDTLEKLIKKYPDNSRISLMQDKLAQLLLSEINENNSLQEIKSIRNKIEQLTRIDRQSYLKSCDLFLIKAEGKELLSSNNIYYVLAFLEKVKKYSSIDFSLLKNRKNELIARELLSSNDFNYSLFMLLVKDVSLTYPGMNDILTKANSDLKLKSLECFKATVIDYVNQKLQLNSIFTEAIKDILLKNLNLSFNSITNEYIYNICQSINLNNQSSPLRDIASALGIFETIMSENLYLSPLDNYWDVISLIKVNEEGKIKRQFYILNESNFYDLIPEIRLNAPIFVAIKQRYSIVSFTTPKIYRRNENGFQVLLYGYTSANQACCPSYEININYKYENGVMAPLVANYINQYYYSLSQENLNNYYNVRSDMSASFFDKCLVQYHENELKQIRDKNKIENASPGIYDPENVNPAISETKNINNSSSDYIFIRTEVEAQFPGGEEKWNKYIYNTIMRSIDDLVEDGQAGTVEVQFIVDKEGNVSSVEAMNMKSSVLARIAIDAIKNGPKWIPAIQNGKQVKAWRRQKIKFNLPDK